MKKRTKKRMVKAKKPRYTCDVCGVAITVDTDCGCADACDIVCCGEQMKPKK